MCLQGALARLSIGSRRSQIKAPLQTTSLSAVCAQVPIPDHMDLYHLHQEAEPSDRTALQSVVDHIEAEVARLNALEEHIMCEIGPEDERLQVRGVACSGHLADCSACLAPHTSSRHHLPHEHATPCPMWNVTGTGRGVLVKATAYAARLPVTVQQRV